MVLIAEALSIVAAEYDAKVFRIGGDAFVLITDTSEKGLARSITLKMEEKLDTIDFRDDFEIHMSMGIALYDGTIAVSDLIDRADEKLYQTKRKHKNR